MEDTKQHLQKLEVTALADYGQYQITSLLEKAEILTNLSKKPEMITAYFPGSNDFILTSVLEVDPKKQTFILDSSNDEQSNRRVLQSEQLLCVTSQDKVKIQFTVNNMRAEIYKGESAFCCPLPQKMLRLQRREYYRLTAPVASPLKCFLTLEDGSAREIEIVDISTGGVGIVDYGVDMELEPHMVFHQCTIEFPEHGTVTTDIEIRNTYLVTLENGQSAKRAGCTFINLSSAMRAIIQRYVHALDRQRHQVLD